MIHSMTAFARVERSLDAGTAVCEIRSVNSKNLDVVVRLPQGFVDKEEAVKKAVGSRISRGRVDVALTFEGTKLSANTWVVDPDLAVGYHESLCSLRDRLGLNGSIDIGLVASAPGVMKLVQPLIDVEAIWPDIFECIEEAVDALCTMRAHEGAFLRADFEQRLEQIENFLGEISQASDGLLSWYQQRLIERIGQLIDKDMALDPVRVAQEAAFLASKSDITEELTRLGSHIAHFRNIMTAPEPSGRKLNFLLQEMHREINTIGSKTEKAGVAHRVVDVKAELDKLREQVQNVE